MRAFLSVVRTAAFFFALIGLGVSLADRAWPQMVLWLALAFVLGDADLEET